MKQFTHKITISVLLLITAITLQGCSSEAPLQPLESNATILAFGDSLTYGTGASRDKAYPAVLEKITGLKVINAGIPGEVSSSGLARLPSLLSQHNPSLIIICHGGNDILRKMNLMQTRGNIQKMIQLAQTNDTQIMLIGVPEFGIFLETLPMYPELARQNNIPIAEDILSEILAKNALKSDQIHPNANGYQLLAERTVSILKQAGALSD